MNKTGSASRDPAMRIAEQIKDFCYQRERQERMRRLQYIEHKKEMRKSRRIVVALSLVVLILIMCSVAIISLNMQISERMQKIEILTADLEAARKENVEMKKRLSNQADYKWVQQEAKKLGMAPVSKGQIQYYTVRNSDFMMQYENIPDS